MRVAHLLRKYNPAEWGGTETALLQLCRGLRHHGVSSLVFCPALPDVSNHGESAMPRRRDPPVAGACSEDGRQEVPERSQPAMTEEATSDPLGQSGCIIKRYKACLPIWGIPEERKRQLISVGGNLVSFELLGALRREPSVALIHTHTLGRLGGVALAMGRWRKVPIVVTIHGGFLDLPQVVRNTFSGHAKGGLDWGRLFGALLKARRLIDEADAILTCNPREAELLQAKYPRQRVQVHPHGVFADRYRKDHREFAREAFPMIRNRQVLLVVGRIDPHKNQGWVVERAPEIFRKHDRAILVLAGACTDEVYGVQLRRKIEALGLQDRIILTGGLPPGDSRLIGLYQEAAAVVLPSKAETFGLVILEAWAAGTCVISTRTSGAASLLVDGRDGWLFDLEQPNAFHAAVDRALGQPESTQALTALGRQRVWAEFDATVLAGRMKQLYEELIESNHALRPSARR